MITSWIIGIMGVLFKLPLPTEMSQEAQMICFTLCVASDLNFLSRMFFK